MVRRRYRRRRVQAPARLRGLALIVDTNIFVAARDTDDEDHERCVALLASTTEAIVTTAPVAGETGWMLGSRLGSDAEAEFYRLVGAGEIEVEELHSEDWERVAELTAQYGDHPLGGFDASLVAIAERLNVDTLATLDHRHFRAVRPKHVVAFTLVP